MSIKVDLSRLIQSLAEAPATDDKRSELNSYLLNAVYWPLVNDARVSLDELDFREFGTEDIVDISRWSEDYEEDIDKITHFCKQTQKQEAVFISTRQFC